MTVTSGDTDRAAGHELAIECRGVSKHFRRLASRPRSLRAAILDRFGFARQSTAFWALRNVDVSLERGRSLALVGANGSGKTTLLRVISGLLRPTNGKVRRHGRMSAMLELGAGFHPDFTGRENVIASAVVSGLTRDEVHRRFDDIVEFAELAEFIDQPVRTYSSGMQARLAFSTAIHIKPDILVIDEVLAVGDQRFQSRCIDRIEEIRRGGGTILLVSHDPNMVRRLCDEALWLKKGQVMGHGPTDQIVDAYLADLAGPAGLVPGQIPLVRDVNRWGTGEIEIQQLRTLDRHGQVVGTIAPGDPMIFEITFQAHRPLRDPLFAVIVDRTDGLRCFHSDTESAGLSLGVVDGPGTVSLRVERLDLAPGDYLLDAVVHGQNWLPQYDHHWHAYRLSVTAPGPKTGVLRPPHTWDLSGASAGVGRERTPTIELVR